MSKARKLTKAERRDIRQGMRGLLDSFEWLASTMGTSVGEHDAAIATLAEGGSGLIARMREQDIEIEALRRTLYWHAAEQHVPDGRRAIMARMHRELDIVRAYAEADEAGEPSGDVNAFEPTNEKASGTFEPLPDAGPGEFTSYPAPSELDLRLHFIALRETLFHDDTLGVRRERYARAVQKAREIHEQTGRATL